MSDLLQNLVTEPYAALVADADFKDGSGNPMVDFIVEDDGDLLTQINTSLSRGTGLACIIDLVDGSDTAPDSDVVVLNPVSIVCELSEKVLINRKGGHEAGVDYLTLRQALAMLITKLKHFTYSTNGVLIFTHFRSVPPPKGSDAAYQMYFDTVETLTEITIPQEILIGTARYPISQKINGKDSWLQDSELSPKRISWNGTNWDIYSPATDETFVHPTATGPVPDKTGWNEGDQGSTAPILNY